MPKESKKMPRPSFVSEVQLEMALLQGSGRKRELEYLIPSYRSQQTQRDRSEGNMNYIKPMIIRRMEEEGLDEMKAARSFAQLAYIIEGIKDGEAAKMAEKARRIIARYLGEEKAKEAVRPERKVDWKIDRSAVREGGDELVKEIQNLLGKRVSLSVGPIPKRVKRRQQRR